MDPDCIVRFVGFSKRVYGLDSERCGVQGVDAAVGQAPCMGTNPGIPHKFYYVSIAGAAHGKLTLAHVARSVAHHGDVHVVEFPQSD